MSSTSRVLSAAARGVFCALVFGILAGPAAQRSVASLFTLADRNSVAQFDTAAQANNFNWTVDGVNQLTQQAFWYRVGSAGSEQSIHLLPIGLQGTTDANFDGNPDTLFVRYQGNGFQIETRYALDGGLPGSHASDMGEQISITNQSGSPLDFHFFQYADFDLSGAPAGDTAFFTNANAVQQSKGSAQLTETVVTPIPSHREINFFPTTLNKLNDALPTTLSDTPAIGVPLGPGDVTWAYQWDTVIAPSATFQISKDKNLSAVPVPEPTSIGLLTIGALLLAGLRRER